MKNEAKPCGIIRPELVARKVAAIRNYESPKLLEAVTANPRIIEVLWFLQYISLQPGGIQKFCTELMETLPERFVTQSMRKAKPVLSFEDKLRIFRDIPTYFDSSLFAGITEKLLKDSPGGALDEFEGGGSDRLFNRDDLDYLLWAIVDGSKDRYTEEERSKVESAFEGLTYEHFSAICREAAARSLPSYFVALCTELHMGFAPEDCLRLWFVDDPIATVLEMMDRRAVQISRRIAVTAVTKRVFDALDYAIQEKAMVRIEGDSRFGKTESVRTWCNMRPGRARLVNVPCTNALSDLHMRVAEALGVEVSYANRKQGIKEKLEFILKHSGMFLVLDEGAFLVPQNYTSATAPARMNWVRTEIVDRGLPLAVVVTPQTFLPSVNRFVKKTGYAMEQFFGRNHRVVHLPEALEPADMLAVARVHFGEMGDDYLALIADLATVSENYLQTVEAIAKLARYFARTNARDRVNVEDIKAAASEVIPRRLTTLNTDDAKVSMPHLKAPCKRRETRLMADHEAEDFCFGANAREIKARAQELTVGV